jgi:hypothetical protein
MYSPATETKGGGQKTGVNAGGWFWFPEWWRLKDR